MNNPSKLERILDAIGNVWGKTTTILLGLGVAVLAAMTDPVLSELVKAVMQEHPGIRWVVILAGVSVPVLRLLAPPAPSVPIKRDDEVVVDRATATVTIAKATEVPANVVTKAAGEKV